MELTNMEMGGATFAQDEADKEWEHTQHNSFEDNCSECFKENKIIKNNLLQEKRNNDRRMALAFRRGTSPDMDYLSERSEHPSEKYW